jgi:hypothetical protein
MPVVTPSALTSIEIVKAVPPKALLLGTIWASPSWSSHG